MKFIGLTIMLVFLKIIHIENRMLTYNYGIMNPNIEFTPEIPSKSEAVEYESKKVIGLKVNDERDEDHDDEQHKSDKKDCSIVVLSNVQNPSMQSLIRRYRYDSNGVLIPSSVKYFVKLVQGLKASPVLLPLNDKAFSPSGGFVRYYKEVPPIPYSW